MKASPTVLYILGVSRSGSTVLDAVLGSHPAIHATGELYLLLRDDYGQPRFCACGKRVPDCPFWAPVLARWEAGVAPGSIHDSLHLHQRFERFRDLPRLAWPPARSSPAFAAYRRWTAELLQAIAETAQAPVIADSSKRPPRLLAMLFGGVADIAIIHTIRDPRGVAWSGVKLHRWRDDPPWKRARWITVVRSALDWVLVNLAAEAIAATHRRVPYVRVRYEDLAFDPAAAMNRIGRAVGVDLSDIGARAARGEAFGFDHIMAGNAARFRGPRPIQIDLDWRTSAPKWAGTTVWLLTGWLARRYGYHK